MIDIEILLDDLVRGKDIRQKKNLKKLNQVLKLYCINEPMNFSITKIGEISRAQGGPSYSTIRATRNPHYRVLIDAWQQNTIERKKAKKPIDYQKTRTMKSYDYMLLNKLGDPALRAAFGQIITERNSYLNQLNILKSQTEIVIDRRQTFPNSHTMPPEPNIGTYNLTHMEIQSLEYFLSSDCREINKWIYTDAGQVLDQEFNCEVLPHGFSKAIDKIIHSSKEKQGLLK